MEDLPGTTLAIDELILRPWRSTDVACPDGGLPGSRDRALGGPAAAIPAGRRGRLHRERHRHVAGRHRRAVRHRRGRERPTPGSDHALRSGRPPGHVRLLGGARGARSRHRHACAPAARGVDVRHHVGHPPARLHHGRQRRLRAHGRARRAISARVCCAPGTCWTMGRPSTASSTPACAATSSRRRRLGAVLSTAYPPWLGGTTMHVRPDPIRVLRWPAPVHLAAVTRGMT